MIPDYWRKATKTLSKTDAILKVLIDSESHLDIKLKTDPFITLARAIVGQQISVKAAETIWGRVVSTTGNPEPSVIRKISEGKLKKAGLSSR